MASDYLERSSSAGWPRTYPYRGEDPLAFASTGFLWDNARAHLLTTRIFGEFGISSRVPNASWSLLLADAAAANQRFSVTTFSEVAALNVTGVLAPNYPGFDLSIPDTWRARVFLDSFAREAPANLYIIQLPGDHTIGLTPGGPTPGAMVANNDLAVGQIVEAISNSPLWPKSVIFIVEDDSQAGVDHVDGHRTVCLVVSPFIRRGAVRLHPVQSPQRREVHRGAPRPSPDEQVRRLRAAHALDLHHRRRMPRRTGPWHPGCR